jgi:hypothetical protein
MILRERAVLTLSPRCSNSKLVPPPGFVQPRIVWRLRTTRILNTLGAAPGRDAGPTTHAPGLAPSPSRAPAPRCPLHTPETPCLSPTLVPLPRTPPPRLVRFSCLVACPCCPRQPSQALGDELDSMTLGSFLRACALVCSYVWCERVGARKAEMGERNHNSGVFWPWDLETTPNTPFITQVQHLFNLHTLLG